jgi:hypothetical protein
MSLRAGERNFKSMLGPCWGGGGDGVGGRECICYGVS